MAKTANRLGKGLSALIPPKERRSATPFATKPEPEPDQPIRDIPINQIRPNPHQPRTNFNAEAIEQLADSIRDVGVLQPLVVRPKGDKQYELVAGERRLRAAKHAGLKTVPVTVRDLTDAESFEIALIENLQREDLAPLERAQAYQDYLDNFGGTIDDLAKRLSESRANVSNYLRLLKLHDDVQQLLATGELGMGQARAIAAITDPQQQLAIARLAVRRNLSVRQVEQLARSSEERTQQQPPARETPSAEKRHLASVADTLSQKLGLRVKLVSGRRKNAGRIVIHYNNLDEFERITEQLGCDSNLEQA